MAVVTVIFSHLQFPLSFFARSKNKSEEGAVPIYVQTRVASSMMNGGRCSVRPSVVTF